METLIQPRAYGGYGVTPTRYGGYGGSPSRYGGYGGSGGSSSSSFRWPTTHTHVHSFNFLSDGYYGGGGSMGFIELVLTLWLLFVIYLIIIKYAGEMESVEESYEKSYGVGKIGYVGPRDKFLNRRDGQELTAFVANAIEQRKGYWEYIK